MIYNEGPYNKRSAKCADVINSYSLRTRLHMQPAKHVATSDISFRDPAWNG
jgi:hypothetical protein